MKMKDIKMIAKERGFKPGRMKKTELVRNLQHAEGNESCFQTGQVQTCGQDQCLWREDCA